MPGTLSNDAINLRCAIRQRVVQRLDFLRVYFHVYEVDMQTAGLDTSKQSTIPRASDHGEPPTAKVAEQP